jgi:hypothetical protein
MSTAVTNPAEFANTRRWPRHTVKMPLHIVTASDASQTVVPGLAIEISRCGMALYAGVQLEPGDRMEVEFPTASRMRIAGVVKNREGYCYGVEFRHRITNESAQAGSPAPAVTEEPKCEDASNYAAILTEMVRAEDKVADLLRRKLNENVRVEPELKRLCFDLLRVRELRRQIEVLAKTAEA